MDPLIESITHFPTVLWTVPMGVATCYWFMTLLGALDIELLDADTDLEAEADVDADLEAEGHGGFLSSLFDALAIGNVPVTIVLSSITSVGWLASMSVDLLVGDTLQNAIGLIAYSGLSLLVCFLLAVYVATWIVKPLKPIFITHTQHGREHLVGRIATVTSSRVTERFGTAVLPDDHATTELLLNVVCSHDNAIAQGDEVSIVGYDEQTDSYAVLPLAAADDPGLAAHEAYLADAPGGAERLPAETDSPDRTRPPGQTGREAH